MLIFVPKSEKINKMALMYFRVQNSILINPRTITCIKN